MDALLKQIRPYVIGWARPRYLPFTTYGGASNLTAATDAFAVTIDLDLTVRRWAQGGYIATTNNGSNYWAFYLRRLDTLATVATLTTAAASAGVWWRVTAPAINFATTTSMIGFYIRAEKIGSPGPLYLTGPAVWVE